MPPTEEEVEAAAEAMFVNRSTNLNAPQTWKEIVVMPQHSITTSFYRENARAALEAAERVRKGTGG